MIFSTYRKIATLITSLVLVSSFAFAPFSFTFNDHVEVRKVEAFFGIGDTVIEVGANLVNNIFTAARSLVMTILTNADYFKEYVLDILGWQLVNVVLEQMLRSTINWVNSGFNGRPLFVEDLRGFLTDVGDVIFDDFVTMNNLQFLCSPFQADIFGALEISYLDYNRFYEPRCRISDVVDNLDAFVGGDFRGGGGWDAWHNVALIPSNNPYGSFMETRLTLNTRISSAQQINREEIANAGGFLSVKDCPTGGVGPCQVVTPGTAINNQLNRSLNTGLERLTIADELDELLSALFNQLLSQAFSSGSGGVRGFSSSPSGGPGYFDTVDNTVPASISNEPIIDTKVLLDQAYDEQEQISNQAQAQVLSNEYGYVSPSCFYESTEFTTNQSCRNFVYLDLSDDYINELQILRSDARSCGPANSTERNRRDNLVDDIEDEINDEENNNIYILDVIDGNRFDVFTAGEIRNFVSRKTDIYNDFVERENSLDCN